MTKNKLKKRLAKVVIIFFVSSLLQGLFLLRPTKLDSAAPLTSASATFSNSRLSYKSSIATTQSSGDRTITIDTDSADQNTNHLFPGDAICFVDSGENGCIGDTTYTVGTIITTTTFTITSALGDNLVDTDFVVATQSGSLAIAFTIASEIPVGGDIYVTIPALNTTGKTNDGFPDTGASTSVNGFDLNKIASTDISITGCTPGNWTVQTPTPGDASNDHRIRIDRATSVCAASTAITVTIDNAPGLANPAPITGHTQGVADTYSVKVYTRDASDNTIDTIGIKIAPVEAVFVSATVEESISLTVASVASAQTNCGADAQTDVTTTAYSVPFGSLASTETFYDAEQQVTVSTNAPSGYKVYIEENDELGKDGGTGTYIPDTPCDTGPCTHTSPQEWVTATYNGFGYSLQDSSGAHAKFEWDDNTSTTGFKAKQLPNNAEGSTQYTAADAEIMGYAGKVSGDSVYVCYRLSVDGTQSAGYYYNKVRYTATATF